MTPTSGRTRTLAVAAALVAFPLALTACTPADVLAPPRAAAGELTDFSSCDELLDYFHEHALDRVGPWGLGVGGYWGDMAVEESAADSVGGQPASGSSDAGSGSGDFSGTNNQVEGVEEPDLVQTDGEIVVTIRNQQLVVVDVAAGEKVGSLRLPGSDGQAELLLDREQDRALVLAREGSGGGMPLPALDGLSIAPAFLTARTVVTLVDLSDPSSPVAEGSIRLEGDYRSARMHDGAARLVLVTQPPGLALTQPRSGSLAAENEAERANRAIIEESTLDDWLPHLQTVHTGVGSTGTADPVLAVPCEQIARPSEFSGLSTMSVLTFDLGSGSLETSSSAGVVATGSTVYASTDRLVVATSPWEAWPVDTAAAAADSPVAPGQGEASTTLHTFDLTAPDDTRYLASGSVPGRLLNQFSLDEADGVIRVATTSDGDPGNPSSSSLVVLAEQEGRLVEQGRVDGLGQTERIYAVRYLSPQTAAIVTFRETDPLYLVDTSDPTAPKVTGELKIPGYSAYLHPLGEDLLLGIGQDATQDGATTGLQASIFDISDPAAPTQVAKHTWTDHYSDAEHDHRAFRYWPATGQLLLPAYAWTEKDTWTGVVSATVDGTSLDQGPRLQLGSSQNDRWDLARRILVIGDQAWVLGEYSLHVADLDTLERRDEIIL